MHYLLHKQFGVFGIIVLLEHAFKCYTEAKLKTSDVHFVQHAVDSKKCNVRMKNVFMNSLP